MKFDKLQAEKIKKYFKIFVYITFAVTIFGYFSKLNFLFDICSQFRTQYLFFGIIALIFCIIRKKKNITSLLIIMIIILNLFSVISVIKPVDRTKKKGFTIEVVNILTKNENYDLLRQELTENAPDIIILEEIDDIWSEELQPIKENYPYSYEISREDNFGIALYSKIHISEIRKLNLGEFNTPAISAFCDYKGKVFELICIHTTPPCSQKYFKNTKKMLETLGKYVAENGHNVIIAGDFNTTPYSYNYQHFIKTSKMKNLSNIFHPTWSTFWLSPFRITLDHLMVTKAFAVKDYSLGNQIGSDHFPIWAEISFKE